MSNDDPLSDEKTQEERAELGKKFAEADNPVAQPAEVDATPTPEPEEESQTEAKPPVNVAAIPARKPQGKSWPEYQKEKGLIDKLGTATT